MIFFLVLSTAVTAKKIMGFDAKDIEGAYSKKTRQQLNESKSCVSLMMHTFGFHRNI